MIKTCKKHQVEFNDYNSSLTKCPMCLKGAVVQFKVVKNTKPSKLSTKKKKKKTNSLKPPTKKQLATKQRQLRNKCDMLWAKVVKLRAGMKCVYCGSTEYLNSHHIYSRAKLSTRWDLENAVCVCSKHHVFSSDWSFHLTPLESLQFLVDLRGQNWYNSLRDRANQPFNLSLEEIQKIYGFLKVEYDKYQ